MFFACFFLGKLFFLFVKQNMVRGREDVFSGTSNSTISCYVFPTSSTRNFTGVFFFRHAALRGLILRGFENLGYLWCIVLRKRPNTKLIPIGSMGPNFDPIFDLFFVVNVGKNTIYTTQWSYDNVKACFNSNWNTDFFVDDFRIKQ